MASKRLNILQSSLVVLFCLTLGSTLYVHLNMGGLTLLGMSRPPDDVGCSGSVLQAEEAIAGKCPAGLYRDALFDNRIVLERSGRVYGLTGPDTTAWWRVGYSETNEGAEQVDFVVHFFDRRGRKLAGLGAEPWKGGVAIGSRLEALPPRTKLMHPGRVYEMGGFEASRRQLVRLGEDCKFWSTVTGQLVGELLDCTPTAVEEYELMVERLRLVAWESAGLRSPIILLKTNDMGVTWRESREGSQVRLKLLTSDSSTLFPVTPKMHAILTHLEGGEARDTTAKDRWGSDVPARVVTVFEPFVRWEEDGYSEEGNLHDHDDNFVVVITRELKRPEASLDEIACEVVADGGQRAVQRATWLSWSMALCSLTNLDWSKGQHLRLRIIYQGQAATEWAGFLHLPVPPYEAQWRQLTFRADEHPLVASEVWPTHRLAICTMVRSEGAYLEEWLTYHDTLGVQQFFIYDNTRPDEEDERQGAVLGQWVLDGKVTLVPWPYVSSQTEALNDCLQRFRHTVDWLTFVDVDEFIDPLPLEPVLEARTWEHLEPKLLDDSLGTQFGAVHCVPWITHCSPSQLEPPQGGVRENYLGTIPVPEFAVERHMHKPIFRPLHALTVRAIGPHFLIYSDADIDRQQNQVYRCPREWRSKEDICIRHYRFKSRVEFVNRREGPDSAYKRKPHYRHDLEREWDEDNKKCVVD